MSRNIVVFDEYLGHAIGGAQRSLHAILRTTNNPYIGINACNGKSLNSIRMKDIHVTKSLTTTTVGGPYISYIRNRAAIQALATQWGSDDILITQGLYGAALAATFPGTTIYFVRDEYQLGRISNTYSGLKRFLKTCYLALQAPCIRVLFRDTAKAIQRSTVIANSHFMASEVKRIYGKDATMVYPAIETSSLENYAGENIVMIGSEEVKGRALFESLAVTFPNQSFVIFGKAYDQKQTIGNITYHPWVPNVDEIYKQAKIVLVPSQWEEAFGRVALEAQLRGVPVIASAIGGLPEIVPKEHLVEAYQSQIAWQQAVQSMLTDMSTQSHISTHNEYDATKELARFSTIFTQITGMDW